MLDDKKEAAARREEGRRGWFCHWQNLKKEYPDRKKLLWGRAWFHKYPKGEIELEWVVPSGLEVSLVVGGNKQITVHLRLLLFSLYISFDMWKWLKKWKVFSRYPGRELSFGFYDWAWHWNVWTNQDEWDSKTPKWRDGYFSIPDFVLGKTECTTVKHDPISATVSLPEGNYPVTVIFETRTWKRPRWPLARVRSGADVDSEQGIPIPGKGENSWDCGEDAYHSIGTSATTIEEAIAYTIEVVTERRLKYGGKNWQPEKKSCQRLARYYSDRARIAGKHARECVDQQSLAEKAIEASLWEAKYDAVIRVAENLGIDLGEKKA